MPVTTQSLSPKSGSSSSNSSSATAGNWALRVPLACLFAYVLELPLVWVWYALVFDHITRTAWLGFTFHRGHWRHARA